MPTVLVDAHELISGPGQARKVFTGISELARSIHLHGLLQKPVVKCVAGRWMIVAGERRVRAIRRLIDLRHWSGPVECELDTGSEESAEFKSLAENAHREEVPIWHLGAKLLQVAERMPVKEIAAKLEKSDAYISRAIRIARGLHPDIVRQLDERLPDKVPVTVLLSISEVINLETLEPDLAKQQKTLNLFDHRKRSVRERSVRTREKIVMKRFALFRKRQLKIPAHAMPVVTAVIDFLDGTTKKVVWPKDDDFI